MNLKNQIMANISYKNNLVYFIILLFTISFISSCVNSEERNDIPKGLIPKKEFVGIMIDVRMVETTIRQKISKGENAVKSTDYYYSYIFNTTSIETIKTKTPYSTYS